jgi:two-component system, OmpR family, phosphate regulon sensor histidine kinase PhoR
MWILIALALAAVVLFLIRRLVRHRRALARLHGALQHLQPFLREEGPGAAGAGWDELCATVNDRILELRRLRQERSGQLTQLEATLGSLQEAVLVVDPHNYIVLANRAVHSIFPHATTILDQRLERVLHSVPFLNYVEAVRQDRAAARQEMEFGSDDERRWVEVTGTTIPPVDDRPGRWALFVLHDITRQKRLERIRQEFVANVSHELRTPLTVIKGNVDTLVTDHATMGEGDRIRFLLTTQRHTERLNSLLDDLLLLSRLESGHPRLQREPVALETLLADLLADYRSRPAAVRHELRGDVTPGLPAVAADPLRLSQVFENLLDNAIKYSPAGSTVTVSIRLQDREVVVTVRDTGPGIPERDLPHIFERFYRVEKGRSRDQGGTGLGLSIVKHIVQLHGGRTWAESTLGQGTAVSFSVPVQEPSAPAVAS